MQNHVISESDPDEVTNHRTKKAMIFLAMAKMPSVPEEEKK
jgi:hypothetical protein